MGILLIGCIVITIFSLSIWILKYWKKALPSLVVSTILLWLFFFALLYIGSSGGFVWWTINTTIWAEFGTFFGAFLLATTLIYQARAFRKQQIEAKFFEMVKYYRDNVKEMKLRNPFYYKNGDRDFEEEFVEGRRVFVIMFKQFLETLKIVKDEGVGSSNLKTSSYYFSIRKRVKEEAKKRKYYFIDEKLWSDNLVQIEISYLSLFFGVCDEGKNNLINSLQKNYQFNSEMNEIQGTKILNELDRKIANYEKVQLEKSNSEIKMTIKKTSLKSKPIKLLGGHQYHLGHYYRHLFQTVKYIENQPSWVLNKERKKDYIKMLRAQMSNYEQALFFINSISSLGRDWEYNGDDGKRLITDYELIKNLPMYFIPNVNPKDYYPGIKFEFERE